MPSWRRRIISANPIGYEGSSAPTSDRPAAAASALCFDFSRKRSELKAALCQGSAEDEGGGGGDDDDEFCDEA